MNRKMRRMMAKLTGSPAKDAKKEMAIRQEYNALCAQAGQVQYQIFAMEKDLAEINAKLLKLNQKYYAFQEARATGAPTPPVVSQPNPAPVQLPVEEIAKAQADAAAVQAAQTTPTGEKA